MGHQLDQAERVESEQRHCDGAREGDLLANGQQSVPSGCQAPHCPVDRRHEVAAALVHSQVYERGEVPHGGVVERKCSAQDRQGDAAG